MARVQAGHTRLEHADDAAQGRDASLAASLAYGFDHAFTEPERAQLAVLHLFRDTVDVDALRVMGDPRHRRSRRRARAAGADRDGLIALLDRAVEVGLLTGYGGGYYGIHPALPWFFTTLFTHHHGAPGTAARTRRSGPTPAPTPPSAATTSIRSSRAGPPDVLPVLRAEEANLLHGLALARTHQLPEVALGCLQGLDKLYDLTGRDRRVGPARRRHRGRLPRPGHRPTLARPRRAVRRRHRLPGADRPGPAGLAHRHPPANRPHRLGPRSRRPLS